MGIGCLVSRRPRSPCYPIVDGAFHAGDCFAEILLEIARTTKALPLEDEAHRTALAEATAALHDALDTGRA